MEQVLFDNYDGYDFDEVKADLLENNGWDDISDENVWSCISDLEYEDWIECKSLLRHNFDGQVIVKGAAGGWRGDREAMNIYDDIDAAIDSICKDCDYTKVWYDGKHLFIKASHHDGTNTFEIKQVTPEGERYYYNWNYGYNSRNYTDSEWDILNRMWESSRYSKFLNVVF